MQNIYKVFETTNVKKVNKKIRKGWYLLDLYAQKNHVIFVLGKRKTKFDLTRKQV